MVGPLKDKDVRAPGGGAGGRDRVRLASVPELQNRTWSSDGKRSHMSRPSSASHGLGRPRFIPASSA